MNAPGLDRLNSIRERNKLDPSFINKDLYRLLYKDDLYITAYEKIKGNKGALTSGTDEKTLDGFGVETISDIIGKMRKDSYQFKPAKRIYIPKPGKKEKRPLGIPSSEDKLVQEVLRMILEAIFEPIFSSKSHGFRLNKSPHTALREVRSNFGGMTWVIEGDIKGAYDNVDHKVLLNAIRTKISDERFISLIKRSLKAGYMEFRKPIIQPLFGTPQGSIISPILFNIYMHEFDQFVEREIIELEAGNVNKKQRSEYAKFQKEIEKTEKAFPSDKTDPLYKKLLNKIKRLKLKRTKVQPFESTSIPVRVRFNRYADDWIIGIAGPKTLALSLKDRVGKFLSEQLHLELSPDKTKVTNIRSEGFLYLGYQMKIATNRKITKSTTPTGKFTYRRTTGHLLKLMVPVQRLITRLKFKGMCNGDGNSISMKAWTVQEDWHIVSTYNAMIRGLINYYYMIDYPHAMRRVYYLLRMSCAKTLSHKHKMGSVAKAFNKYGKDLTVPAPKGTPEGKGKLTSLVPWDVKDFRRRKPLLNLKDPFTIQLSLRTRSLVNSCCVVCGSPDRIEMHHIRHIKSSSNPDSFAKVIGRLNRSQIPVCKECHWKIHKGEYDQMSLSDLKSLSG